jgi:DNA-binding response OmpR family regulator
MRSLHDQTVLLIEDDAGDAHGVELAFQRSGFSVELQVVRNAEEATAYISGIGPFTDRSQFPIPALILLDMNLPGRSGLQFVDWLRHRDECRIIPVIALTGAVDYDLIKKAFAAGVNSYIQKPKEFAELEAAIRLLLKYWLILSARPP